ncbi:MAG: hypothetical protein N2C13_02605 [Chloroflexota bacterium]
MKSTREQTKVYETRTTRDWLDEDGIIHSVIFLPRVETVKEDVLASLENFSKLAQGIKRPVLNDLRNLKNANRESRAAGVGKEAIKIISAIGLVVRSPVQRTVGNLFQQINRPPFPTKIFTSETEAIAWLKEFVE